MTGKKHVYIIGGGPAGLMAAEILAGAGCAVTVFEQMTSIGRKFLMAGRGGLNLTHSEELDTFMTRYGAAAAWLRPMIDAFTPADLRRWCEGLGQETFTGSSGRVFPRAMKASPLLRQWRARLDALGVTIRLQQTWQGWDDQDRPVFNGAAIEKPDALFLAAGGASWPKLGATASWVPHLAARGVDIAPFAPANCGFCVGWSDYFRDKYAGQPLKSVALSFNGRTVAGEAMIAAAGIEGGGIYALSAALRDHIAADGRAVLHIDLKPGLSAAALAQRLSADARGQSLSTRLRKSAALPPVAAALLREGGADIAALPPAALAARIKSCPVTLTAPFSIDRAISAAGGIRLPETDDALMLRRLPGVFVAGEMLDWEAPTGGYLLQACFSTAAHAARGLQKWLETC